MSTLLAAALWLLLWQRKLLRCRRSLLGTVRAIGTGIHLSCKTLLALLGIGHWLCIGLEVLGSSLACNIEAEERWLIEVNLWGKHDVLRVGLEEDVGKGRTEVGSIKSISAVGNVHFLALGAIDFDSILTKLVAQCVRHHSLLVTKGARTEPVSTLQVLSVN